MNTRQRPQQIFNHQSLPDFPPSTTPGDRFPIWSRLIACIAVSTGLVIITGLRVVNQADNPLANLASGVVLLALGLGVGTVVGLVWVGADYLEFRNQRGLRTSPIFANLFCMGLSSVMIWAIITFPPIIVGTFLVMVFSL